MKLKEYIGKKEDIRKSAILSFFYSTGRFNLNSSRMKKLQIGILLFQKQNLIIL